VSGAAFPAPTRPAPGLVNGQDQLNKRRINDMLNDSGRETGAPTSDSEEDPPEPPDSRR
jgi:hypothetical protein